MKYIDTLIDRITMYRLLLYYLTAILCIAMFFGAVGWLSYSPYSIAISATLFVGICYGVNYIFAKLYNTPTNSESSILTGLILALIVSPITSPGGLTFIVAAAGLAMASKYILAIRNKHIFNPAAVAVVLTALGPQESASWWVGATVLAPFVIIGGLLIARKIRRSSMVYTFLATALASTAIFAALAHKDVGLVLQTTLLHSSLFFLAFIMLTEPWTSPTTRIKRYIYAAIVGVFFAPALHIGTVYSTPELALVIGNIAAFVMSPMVKTKLLIGKRRFYGEDTEDIELIPERAFSYQPGQYIEMTFPHSAADRRGMRRYFTLASSPTEHNLRLGIRYYNHGSTFKKNLKSLSSDAPISVGQLGGDFVLPKDNTQKLAFIAGGIGITPFRSMIKYLSDTNDMRSVTLLYGERSTNDIAYSDIFEEARRKVAVDTTYITAAPTNIESDFVKTGRIDQNIIRSQIPDYTKRIFYVSGPQPMVRSIKKILLQLGIPKNHIKLDYFPGYA
jgi:glycine betaine catabolism B